MTNNTHNKFNNSTHIIPLIDLTSLNEDDNKDSINTLCRKAITPFGSVAAVCVYPKFVSLAANFLNNTSIKVATVINFPTGDSPILEILRETEKALSNGANEIDMVFPYHTYMQGNKMVALDFISKIRELCKKNIKLKVIIETGELGSLELIKAISIDVIHAGADFIKTSTGKTRKGATKEAAMTMLATIKDQPLIKKHSIGLKVSGGIRTISDAESYIQLACEMMGHNWVNPNVFRIGASKLLDEIIASQ